MFSRARSRAGAVLLAAVAVAANGLVATAVHAQDTNVDPTTRFVLPAPADLAADAQRTVDDTPDEPTDQDDLTPVIEGAAERLASLPAEAWEVPALAATLADMGAAFALVRDGIAFDAYRGSLRGAQGTLSARAGNAFDRAALLKALLDAQRLTTRFAFGSLDADTAQALVDRSFDAPTSPLADDGFTFDAAVEDAIEQRARRDHALLVGAVGDRLADLDADATQVAIADVTPHAWVQVEQTDGSWLDLDPSMPSAQPGDTLVTADSTADAIPATETHTLGIRVLAEHLVGSSLDETVVMDESLPAAAAGDQRIFLTFTPTGEGGGGLLNPGGLFGGGGGGPTTWSPTLLVDHNAWDGDPILFTGEVGGGGLMGPGEQADLVRLVIELTVTAPGAEPRVIRQVLADRLSAEQRAAGGVTADALAPVADDEGTPGVFRTIVHVMVSTGAINPRGYRQDQGYAATLATWGAGAPDTDDMTLNEALVPSAMADLAQAIASERRFVPAIDDATVRTYVASPRVFLATRSADAADLDVREVVTDLAVDGVRTLPSDGAAADAAARQLWYGALEGAVETEIALANASAFDADERILEGVSFDMGQPLSVISREDARPEAASEDLDTLLAAGGLAVVPGDVPAARTWWELGADATTRSVLAPRLGGNGVRGPSGPKRPILPVNPPDKPRDQRKQQQNDGKGNEYGTLVDNVAGKVQKGARAAGRIVQDGFDDVAKPLMKLK